MYICVVMIMKLTIYIIFGFISMYYYILLYTLYVLFNHDIYNHLHIRFILIYYIFIDLYICFIFSYHQLSYAYFVFCICKSLPSVKTPVSSEIVQTE